MNICFTSTFEGTFEDFNNMMNKIRTAFPGITDINKPAESAELPCDKEGWCKVITIANVIDFDKMEKAMTASWVAEWDKKHNNTDIVYKLERIN
ncbi:MAG: hypothetical protein CL758_06945 [Chloroflexi bacterium]|nr:hypothetical protein [Chloroflexota bacterium]|tara:strand:- start:667 stop:948 length:282 start_codon:yes stop_codon:yes gene_type:complete